MDTKDVLLLKRLTPDQLIERFLQLKNVYDKEAKEFEEYKTTSQEMEQMMEREIEYAQREAKSTAAKLHQLRLEAEKAQVTQLRAEQDSNRVRIRELEQKNDDLERHERNNQQEVADLERKVNEMTEKLTLLENELAEKQTTAEEMYRLREEMRVPDRPLLMVGPLRAERTEHTPDEPPYGFYSKHQRTTSIASSVEANEKSNGVSYVNGLCKDSGKQNSQVLPSLLPSSGTDGRSFANCVNRIVKELMVKVDRLENILTGSNLFGLGWNEYPTNIYNRFEKDGGQQSGLPYETPRSRVERETSGVVAQSE
ncbi:unnamed protein product [Angiostrongylus costaricensis]|uniref:NUDE_C domain-containing protein n=1 Tax=Angiostrongylus costaricensis TaxID=334426 RepID=A0A0R3PSU1_ANGCS|nr:unnamed protein product [Angiostrongylus costaricensis]